MLGWLKRKRTEAMTPGPAVSGAADTSAMRWLPATTLPIPDWNALDWPMGLTDEAMHALCNGYAAAWLDRLAAALPPAHRRLESDHFLLLASLADGPARVLLDYLERSRKRVLAVLPGIASDQGHGKTPVLVFADEEHYYRYVAHYGNPHGGTEAFSGGMFIDAGYGHFVFAAAGFEQMEPVVVHELTHRLVSHLPIPAWLNEGLAVNTERRFAPAAPRYRPDELAHLFGTFWNADTIQEFWSGKSFLRPDDGQPLSYELAKLLVQLLDKDYAGLAAYCNAAQGADAGEAAARELFGSGVGHLAGIVLGEGDWSPRPQRWAEGVEKGQFHPVATPAPALNRLPRPAPGTAPR